MKIVCRICKIYQGEFYTLDTIVSEWKLVEIYNRCLQLNADCNDKLPQSICNLCFELLQQFLKFLLKAQASESEYWQQQSDFLHPDAVVITDHKVADANAILLNTGTANEISNAVLLDNNKLKQSTIPNEDLINLEYDECSMDMNDDDVSAFIDYDEVEENVDDIVENSHILYRILDSKSNAIKDSVKNPSDEAISLTEDSNKWQKEKEQTKSCFNGNDIYEHSPPHSDGLEMITALPIASHHRCNTCGGQYSSLDKLEQHRLTHCLNNDEYKCPDCNSLFPNEHDYRIHVRSHTEQYKFTCDFCDKTFMARANLKSHLYSHTKERPFVCDYCGKTFQQKSILKTHMTLHIGKPNVCSLCHPVRRFSRPAHLNIHMRQHNNERPYQCTECSLSYMQKCHLDRHIACKHLGVRFQCGTCDKVYTKKSSLTVHIREEHSNMNLKHKCTKCNMDFGKVKALYYHIKTKHPNGQST